MRCKAFCRVFVLSMILAGCAGRYVEPVETPPLRPDPRSVQGKIVHTARELLGTPYLFGGATPKGFDCSGYVFYVFKESIGKSLPRRAVDQIKLGKPLPPAKRGPGDLVYFWIHEQKIYHVGISIGGDRFIHAPSSSGRVNIQDLQNPYWKERYRGARRVI